MKPGMQWPGNPMVWEISGHKTSTHKKGYRQRENQSEREMCFEKQSWKGIHGAINWSWPRGVQCCSHLSPDIEKTLGITEVC